MPDSSLERFRAVVEAALAHLESRRQEVNDLNVFPVADGDTGDNMALTLRAVLDELNRLSDDRLLDEVGRHEIVDSVARAALLGARGNSGVILSQLIRGAAEELISRPGELVDPVLIGAAMARAADRAYGSMREPVEGTILTVVREMASRVASELAHMPEPRLSHDAEDATQNALIAEVLERALEAGQESVKRGPDLLPVLREAGVVDAGGHALTILFAGMVAALRGADPPPLAHYEPARVSHPEHESSTYRYCTNFVVTGHALDRARFTTELERLGDSVLVVGDGSTLKVHVHTDQPERAAGLFSGSGEVSRLDVADMREQLRDRSARLAAGDAEIAPACGALAVVAGEGMRRLFEGLGARTLEGGATLNPSTYELLAGIHSVPGDAVILLPNNPNTLMAAERAAGLSEKDVRVIPTRSQPAGLAALFAFDPERDAAANERALRHALDGVHTGAVAEAARDDRQGRFRRGESVGFVDDELVAWGEPRDTLATVLGTLSRDAELITCITGQDAPLPDEALPGLVPDGVELEVRASGQPSYWWQLAAE